MASANPLQIDGATRATLLPYRPDVDGLRAIAVLAVIAFHAFPGRAPGGFLGVDIFFVISGFLISSIILKGQSDGTFSFFGFYARRIRRIFPSLIVVLAGCLLTGWFILSPDEFRNLGKHVAAGAGFAYNLLALSEAGDRATVTQPLIHLWSLGVEEQFYLAWPLILVVASRRKARLPWVVGVLLIASLSLNIALIDRRQALAFYLPVTRLWELAMGAMLACVAVSKGENVARVVSDSQPRWSTVRAVLACGALLGIVASLLFPDIGRAIPGGAHLPATTTIVLPTLSTAVLIATGPDTWLHRRLLAHPFAVFIGLISYPLYLWHWPLLSFAHIAEGRLPSLAIRALLVGAVFLLAWLTYVAVETPIRFRGRAVPRAIALVSVMCVVGVLGILIGFGAIPSG